MSHGSDKIQAIAPRSKFYRGPFGRIFADLPSWVPEGVNSNQVERFFLEFANARMIEQVDPVSGETIGPTEFAAIESRNIAQNPERVDPKDSNIPAAYTYFGQFVDHDITFDPASSLMRQNDPSGLLNHRTPRLDLDNLYGSGPNASPHLYDSDEKFKFFINEVANTRTNRGGGKVRFELKDLPRIDGKRAVIGDPRNDENLVVSQLHLAFLMAHNHLYDNAIEMLGKLPKDLTEDDKKGAFDRARQTLRWLYQHIVWHDFIFRVTDSNLHQIALEYQAGPIQSWKMGLKGIYSWKHFPYMPVEFSVAAYRFGHAMVRNGYRTNLKRGTFTVVPIFDNSKARSGSTDDLRGKRKISLENVIQWDWFFQMTSSVAGAGFPQKSRRLDTKLSNALGFLHEQKIRRAAKEPKTNRQNFLAFRNLLRGDRFGLPSGTSIAKKLGFVPVPLNEQVEDGMTTPEDVDALWYYILKEAGENGGGNCLGEVGSAILCATFAGLLKGDPNSFFNMRPDWHPEDDALLQHIDNKRVQSNTGVLNQDLPVQIGVVRDRQDANGKSIWTAASIIRLSGLPIDSGDINKMGKAVNVN